MTIQELQQEIQNKGYDLPKNIQNPRHLARVIETEGRIASPQNTELRPNTLMIGLTIDKDILKRKLAARVEHMIAEGFTDEVRALLAEYPSDTPALQSTGYKAFRRYLTGEISLEQAKADFVRNDFQLAKRQRTWFKRNKSIHRLRKQEEVEDLITTFLNK
jgi:tRNA dimethylallyltransferase